jgi:hypothetical protein
VACLWNPDLWKLKRGRGLERAVGLCVSSDEETERKMTKFSQEVLVILLLFSHLPHSFKKLWRNIFWLNDSALSCVYKRKGFFIISDAVDEFCRLCKCTAVELSDSLCFIWDQREGAFESKAWWGYTGEPLKGGFNSVRSCVESFFKNTSRWN